MLIYGDFLCLYSLVHLISKLLFFVHQVKMRNVTYKMSNTAVIVLYIFNVPSYT